MALDTGFFLLFTCYWMLILMCCQPLAGSSQHPTAYKRALQEFSSNKPEIIRVKLIHRDQPESPLGLPSGSISTAGRIAASASRQEARITRRLAAGVQVKTPIKFNRADDPGVYFMTLYLGNPVQKFIVFVDTGSDLVWVQCQPCKSPYRCYNETNPIFEPSASSSYSAVPCRNLTLCNPSQPGTAACNGLRNCQISYSYATAGSGIAGVLSTETISFSNTSEGQLDISNLHFGCMNNNTATFGKVDGLVGFGRGPISLPSQLSRSTSFNLFSCCLVPFIDSANLTSSLLFGVSNSNGLRLVYTPILNNTRSLYLVNMTGISINGTAVSIPRAPLEYNSSTNFGGTIFDSGTTSTLFTRDISIPVVERLNGLITYPSINVDNNGLTCYNISGVEQPAFPSMSLHFSEVNGSIVDFPLSGQNLFIPFDDGTVQCLIISSGDSGVSLIGNVAQADHYFETELVNMKIGGTSRDCSLPM